MSVSRIAGLWFVCLALASRVVCAAEPIRLGVMISVDGLSQESLIAHRAAYVAGLKRLLDEGRVHAATHYNHMNTETGPGHASLGTGAFPCRHGIVANEWFEADAAEKLRRAYCVDVPNGPGAGRLLLDTLGDRLVAQRPGAHVVSISGKDRGAILMAGRSPQHAVFWYDRSNSGFRSSALYAATAPDTPAGTVLARFNAQRASALAQLDPAEFVWKTLSRPGVPPLNDTSLAMNQWPVVGLGFDHDLRVHRNGAGAGAYHSPLVDRLSLDLAIALLDDDAVALGRDDIPDLLLLSLSGNDNVAHYYGPESNETRDVLLRLDLELGRFLDALERHVGRQRLAVELSSDHGMPALPEPHAGSRDEAQRRRLYSSEDGAAPLDLADWLNRLIAAELCLPAGTRPILAIRSHNLFYDHSLFPFKRSVKASGVCGRTIQWRDVDIALQHAVATHYSQQIDALYLMSAAKAWDPRAPYTAFVQHDYVPGRSGDAQFVPKPDVVVFVDPIRGTGHGSPHSYDTHVPWLEWGAGITSSTIEAPDAPYDIAPRLAEALGVTMLPPEQRLTCPEPSR